MHSFSPKCLANPIIFPDNSLKFEKFLLTRMDSYQKQKQTLKPIETKISIEREAKLANDEKTVKGEPLSPAARLFRPPHFNCSIIVSMGCKTEINMEVAIGWLDHTLFKHPRFTSRVVIDDKKGGEMRWVPTKINLENHIFVLDLDPNMDSADQFVEDYISDLSKTPMDLSKPPWEVHVLNVKTSIANAVAVFRIHHSAGDGASLMSLLLACTRQTSNPEALPTIPTKKRAGSNDSSRKWWFLLAIWSALRLIWNTLVDVMLFVATILFLSDTKTSLKGAPGVDLTPKRFVHVTVSLDDIKLVKNAMKMTINDVLLGVTQAGLSRYLNRSYSGKDEKDDGATKKKNNLPKSIRLRATVVFNIRPAAGIQELADMMENGSKVKWGNWLGYVLLPFRIALPDDPLDYIRQSKATIDRKKHSLEAIFTLGLMLKSFGVKISVALSRKVLSNTTLLFSGVVGPQEEISFCGHPVAYIAPSVYGLPFALTIHFQSYVNTMTISMAVDQGVIPDPHLLCDDLKESLKLIKNTVIERGLNKNGVC